MLLQKVIVALMIAIPLAIFSSSVSFDFENYVFYASNVEKAFERFIAEPIFPLFVAGAQLLWFSPQAAIQTFIFISAFIVTYAVMTLACEDRRWSLARAGLTVAISMPFVLFSLIIPRQGLATGTILITLLTVRREGRLMTWRTLILLFISFLAHTPTGALGAVLIFFGHGKNHHFFIIISISIILFLFFAANYPEFLKYEDGRYTQYFGNLRDTGRFRMALFSLVSFSYLILSSRKNGGFLGVTPVRSLFIASFFWGLAIAAYAILASDAVRVTYFIGVVMIIDISRRFVLIR